MSSVFFPKQEEAFKIAFGAVTGLKDIDFIVYGGAIRGGKTVWGLNTLLFFCEVYPNSRWAVVRATNPRISQNTIPSFNKIRNDYGDLKANPYSYTHPNGSKILFISENFANDKELDAFKGLEVNGFLLEEINEEQFKTLNKCFERAGAWIIPGLKKQPEPIILGTCNPTQGWVKEKVYDPWKNGTLPKKWVYIPSKITDNPYIPESYKKSLLNLPQYEYEVFVNGNWDISLKTGNEFYWAFEIDKHVKPVSYDEYYPVHISLDSNVHPYIAVTVWQFFPDDKIIRQIHELPCADPYNVASKAGKKIIEYLKSIDYNDIVHLYGDASLKNSNNIDDNKRSFYSIVEEEIKKEYSVRDHLPRSNTSVAKKGEFINALYEGWEEWRIEIGDQCKTSISDYIDTKIDPNGAMLKKRTKDAELGVSYEENGHLCDTKKDFIAEVMSNEFSDWSNRFSDPVEYETIDLWERNLR